MTCLLVYDVRIYTDTIRKKRYRVIAGRAHYVNYENINNSNLDGMSLASFCQSRAVYIPIQFGKSGIGLLRGGGRPPPLQPRP